MDHLDNVKDSIFEPENNVVKESDKESQSRPSHSNILTTLQRALLFISVFSACYLLSQDSCQAALMVTLFFSVMQYAIMSFIILQSLLQINTETLVLSSSMLGCCIVVFSAFLHGSSRNNTRGHS